jgi:HlyD family secretion protein
MKRAYLLIVFFAVVVIGGAGYLGARRAAAMARPAAPAPTTVPVTRGQVQQTVTIPGPLDATRQAALSMQTAGRLAAVRVRPGQRVAEGAVLAELDTTGLALQLQDAQANLKIAQSRLTQTQQSATVQEIAAARARLAAAQATRDKLKAGPTAADVAAAQAAVAGAQAAYNAAAKGASTTSSQLEAAAASLQKAEVALQRAQAAYDQVAGAPGIGAMPQSQQLQSATIDYQQAQANYDALKATAGANATSQVQTARAQLEQAQAVLVKLQGPPAASDIANAEAQVAQAQNDLNKLLAGSDAATLEIAEAGVTQADIAVKQAQLALNGARLTAPFAGVVQDVHANPGDVVMAGAPLIDLVDPAALEMTGTVIEEDVGLVQVGQVVEVFVDALPDRPLTGHVSQIVPRKDTSDSRTVYPVIVTLDGSADGLLPGMTVDGSVIIAQRDNVLKLPRALARATAANQATVQVWAGDHAETRTVMVGLRGDVDVEITGGLREGEQVVAQ